MLILLFLLVQLDSIVTFNFVHTLKDGNNVDSARGLIFKSDSAFYIYVKEPLEQVIYFSGDTMVVNYPREKQAFKIKSGITFKFQTPGGPVEKLGTNLKKAGFIFLKRERNGDSSTEIWIHQKMKMKMIYTFEKGYLIGMTTLSEKGDTIVKVEYNDYAKVLTKEIPLTLVVKTSGIEEVYKLSNPRVIPFSDSLKKNLLVKPDSKVILKGFEK